MKYRAIIRDAWSLTQEHKRLIWAFAFVPAVLNTLVSIGYLAYQGAALWTTPLIRSRAEGQDADIFISLAKRGLEILKVHPTLGTLAIVILAILALIYLMLPVVTQGALIQSITRIRKNEPVSLMKGLSSGLGSFLVLFEYHLMVKSISAVSIFTEAVFIFRSFGPESFPFFGGIFALFFIVAVIFTLLFTFSEYYIVLEKRGVFPSILASSGMVIRQWHHLLFMLMLMAIISVRIIFNVLATLLIPVLVVVPIALLAGFTLSGLGVVIGAILGLVALYFTSYFLGVFHVFVSSVWTFTFLELTSQETDQKSETVNEEEK